MDFARVLDLVSAHLSSRGLHWAVAGGAAMQAYGLARATQDLDFVTEAAAAEGLVNRMESAGYETLYRSEGFSNHLHPDQHLLLLEDVDRAAARRYFEDAGLLERFNEIARFL